MSEELKFQKQRGYGNCPDCAWHEKKEGCNVPRDSKVCLLNKTSSGTTPI